MAYTPIPLFEVSILVLTRNCPVGLSRAIESVIRQEEIDLGSLEVIILDRSDEASVETQDSQQITIRTLQLSNSTVGAARAKGLAAASAAFVAYCDDDAEWQPDHLSTLLSTLRESEDAVLAFGESHFVPPVTPPAPVMPPEGNHFEATTYVRASDVLHRAWAARAVGGFDFSLDSFEDWDLWLRIGRAYRCVSSGETLTTHYSRELDMTRKVREETRSRIAECQGWWSSLKRKDALVRSRAKPLLFDPATWAPERRQLLMQASLRENLGFGVVGRNLLLGLEAEGIECTVGPLRELPPPGFERFYGPVPSRNCLAFLNDYSVGPAAIGCEKLAYYMMHESTLIPPDRIDEINRFVSVLFVPCRQNKEAFEQCGVRIPVEVLPHGVDPEQFPLLERPKRETFTFGTFGDLTIRKGVDVLLRAFIREFQPHEPARLLIKRSWDHRELPCSVEADPRIELRSGFLEHTELLDFLRELDAFILPSRGEGFGLCGLEAMATGLPTVATNWSGPADYLDQEDSFPLDYDLVDAGGSWALGTQFFGQWAEPSVEHLQVLMRWMYEHPAESSESGCKASARVHSQWTWSRASALLRDGLDRLGADHLSDKS